MTAIGTIIVLLLTLACGLLYNCTVHLKNIEDKLYGGKL